MRARLIGVLSLAVNSACSGLATGLVADALSGSGSTYATDNDPEFVEEAVPFGLKTMESVLASKPEHRGLLTALAGGYTQYAYAFLIQEAHAIEDDDYDAAQQLKLRAKNLSFRARDYGLRGLTVEHERFEARLRADAGAALAAVTEDDVALLYWTAGAWALGISAAGLDPELVADLPLAGALAERALALDETWNDGALHDFMVSYETARPNGDLEAAQRHYERALELNQGRRAGTYLAYAEGVAVKTQDLKLFESLIDKALAIDVDAYPEDRLANVIMQRRARRLRARIEDLFLDADLAEEE